MLTATSFVVFPRNSMGACWPPRLKAPFFWTQSPRFGPLPSRLPIFVLDRCTRSITWRIEGLRSLAGPALG